MNPANTIIELLNLAETNRSAFRTTIKSRNADELEEFCRVSNALFPNRSWPLVACAKVLSHKRKDDHVAHIMEMALLIPPVDFHAITNYARALYLTGRCAEIPAHINRHLPREDDQEQALLLYHKANALFDLKQTEEAILVATKAYNTYSESDEVTFIYGYALYMQKNFTKAISLYYKAISLDSEMNFAYFYIALAYLDCGYYTNAMNTLLKLKEVGAEYLALMKEFPQFRKLLDTEHGGVFRDLLALKGITLS